LAFKRYWPEAGGDALATRLIINSLLQFHEVKAVVVSGAEYTATVGGVEYVYTPFN